MRKLEIPISKTARVFTTGNQGAPYQWLCLHGYGQLGSYWIKKFTALSPQHHQVFVPEGFHRFYLEGTYGRVGASWMTKEDRLTDIADNKAYLQQVYDTYFSPDQKWVCFAFSQGASTLIRFLADTPNVPHTLIIWAGSLPPEVDYAALRKKLENTQVIYAIGDEDEYATSDAIQENTKLLSQLSLNAKEHPFRGKHKVYPKVLTELVNKYLP